MAGAIHAALRSVSMQLSQLRTWFQFALSWATKTLLLSPFLAKHDSNPNPTIPELGREKIISKWVERVSDSLYRCHLTPGVGPSDQLTDLGGVDREQQIHRATH